MFRYAAALALGLMTIGALTPAARAQELADSPSISNFHQVNDVLFRSGHIEDAQFSELTSVGVKSVLSLEDTSETSAEHEQAVATAAGFQFESQAWSPIAKPTLAEIDAALAYVMDPAHQPVLVHCTLGSDRTGIVVAAYRIRYEHWTEEDAIKEMKQYGHSVFLYWWDSVLDEVH